MVSAMAGQERDADIVVLEDVDWCGWVAPGRLGIDDGNGDVASKALQTGATDHSDQDRSWSWAVSIWQLLPLTEGRLTYRRRRRKSGGLPLICPLLGNSKREG